MTFYLVLLFYIKESKIQAKFHMSQHLLRRDQIIGKLLNNE